MRIVDTVNEPPVEVISVPEASGPLSEKLRSGVLWITGLNLFRDFLQFGVMLVLVRILDPKVYGQFGLVTSFVGFFTAISFRSFLEHTLQMRPNERVDYQTHFTIGGAIQLCVFLGMNMTALALRHMGQYAEIAPLVNVMSVFFVLDWISEFRVKMLERSLNWKRLRLLQAAGLAVNAMSALTLALSGFGVYALLLPGLAMTLPFIFDLLVTQRWRPTWTWNWKNFDCARRYGLTRVASSLLYTGRGLLEGGILVHTIGFTAFGIYGRATGLATICCMKLPSFLTFTLYPVLTKIEPGSSAYSKASGLVLRGVAWLVIPIAVLFSVVAEPVINLIYGQKWMATIPILPWALCAATATALMVTSSLLLLGNLQQRRCMESDLVVLLGTAASLLLILPQGIAAYLIGITVTQVAAGGLIVFWLYRSRAITSAGIQSALILPSVAATCSFLVLELVRVQLLALPNGLLGAAAYGAGFLVVYVVVVRLLSPRSLRELLGYIPAASRLRQLFLLGA